MGRYWTLGLLLLAATLLVGCRQREPLEKVPPASKPAQTEPAATTIPTDGASEEGQLMALAKSEDEARQLAKLYGIELISYSYGVAVFHTEEDPDVVIRRGIENGWPELSRNDTVYAF